MQKHFFIWYYYIVDNSTFGVFNLKLVELFMQAINMMNISLFYANSLKVQSNFKMKFNLKFLLHYNHS